MSFTGSGKEVLARQRMIFRKEEMVHLCRLIVQRYPNLWLKVCFGHTKGPSLCCQINCRLFRASGRWHAVSDEIGELLQIQAKSRAIQEKEITPVGNSESRPVDVRGFSDQ